MELIFTINLTGGFYAIIKKIFFMINIKDLQQNAIFIGNRKQLELEIVNSSKKYFEDPFGINKNILFYQVSDLQIKIDKIREIKKWVSQTFDGIKIVIISSFIWSEEVQNSLLKILEETPSNTYIYLISQNKYSFLETIFSRMNLIKVENSNSYLNLARELLQTDSNKRLENKNLKKILLAKVKTNQDGDEEGSRKDLEIQLEFFEALFKIYSDYFKNLNGEEKKIQIKYIQKFQEVEDLIKTEGISLNYFIEFFILFLPKVV